MKIKIMDGRCLLSLLKKSYDIIVSQPGEPSRNSCAYLYTLEFWQLVKEHLQPDGVFSQWLPLYAIDRDNLVSLCRTFATIFPNAYMVRPNGSAEVILLGLNTDKKQAADSSVPISITQWLTKYKQMPYLLNKDDFPIVQYKLQALQAAKGNCISHEVDKMLESSPIKDPALPK